MIIHKFKKIILFKKFNINSCIKNIFKKNFFFLKKKNFVFIFNFYFFIEKFQNILIFNKKFFSIITNNDFFYFKKKTYNNKKKFRFLLSFFSFINFNSNNKINGKNSDIYFFPKLIIFLKKKYKQIIIFSIIKKKFLFENFSNLLNFLIIKIKNLFLKKYLIKKKIQNKNFVKKKFFFKNICKIKNNIFTGNLTQCVISNIIIFKKIFNKNISISNYNFFIKIKNFFFFGNSPEFLIRKEKKKFLTKPIAGTLNKNFEFKKILKNKKEISEHLMLLDLSLNDVYKNNVKNIFLNRLIYCEYHKNIIHLVSEIFFFTDYNKNYIKCMSPAGTLSGSPKKNSIIYINFIEKNKRIFFGGNFFFINNQNIESCILIRFILNKNNNNFLQSGAGIIYNSNIILEWLETISKKELFLK